MRVYFPLLILVILYSCTDQLPVTAYRTMGAVVVDTGFAADRFLAPGQQSDYPIYYIGPARDTLRIGSRYSNVYTVRDPHDPTQFSSLYDDQTLRISVDTAVKTNSPVEYVLDDNSVVRDSSINYHAFLFSIRNRSDAVLYLGHTFSVYYLHREAKNMCGEWVAIDRKLSQVGLCVSSQPAIYLRPDEIVLAKLRRYSGSLVTDFRLVFGHRGQTVYSNVFRDSIDPAVLEEALMEHSQ